jgi:hypothetical protein
VVPDSLFTDEKLLRDIFGGFVLNQQFEYFALAVGKDELALVIDALQCSHPSLPG